MAGVRYNLGCRFLRLFADIRSVDALSALCVLVGTGLLGLKIERYALLNVAVVAVLVVICLRIIRAYKRSKAAAEAAVPAA
jgi:hypothetical protein